MPENVCIKVSTHQDTWLREAYFGLLLNDHPRAIRVFDAFPLAPASASSETGLLYCLVLECAQHGDLSAFLARTMKPWREQAAPATISRLLQRGLSESEAG